MKLEDSYIRLFGRPRNDGGCTAVLGEGSCILTFEVKGSWIDKPPPLISYCDVTMSMLLLELQISRQSIDACKDYFRDDLVKTDWQLMVELKKLFQIL